MPNQYPPVFDGHNDTLLKLELSERSGKSADFYSSANSTDIDLPRSREGNFAGGLFAMFTPSYREPDRQRNPADPRNKRPVDQPTALGFTMDLFARARRLERNSDGNVRIVGSAAEIEHAIQSGALALVPHIEGAECIDPDFAALDILHAAGLRSLGPVWSRENQFGHGAPMALMENPQPGAGLTEDGLRLVAACEALGILVDLSHLTLTGFWDAAKVATKPLVASHSNAHAISPSGRNLTDSQLAAIAESGGLVGLNFHVAFTRPDCRMIRDTPLELYVRHLDHLLSILGEDGVALGSDFDGCVLPNAIKDVSQLPALIDQMRAAEYGEELIAKICWRNWLGALERAQS